MKNIKNAKNEDPCRRSATSLILGDVKKSLFSKKNCHFAWEGWSKLKIDYFLQKKHSMKGVLKNCKDVPCKITTFEETSANDIGCAKVKVAILHGRS